MSYKKTDSNKYTEGENENLPDGLDVLLSNDAKVETYTVIASEDSYVSGGESDIADAANIALGDSAILDFKANYNGKQEQHRIVYLKFNLSDYSVSDFDRILSSPGLSRRTALPGVAPMYAVIMLTYAKTFPLFPTSPANTIKLC